MLLHGLTRLGAIMRKPQILLPILSYTIDLLPVAKSIVHSGATPERLARLADAVERFEDSMPLDDNGEIFTIRQARGGQAR